MPLERSRAPPRLCQHTGELHREGRGGMLGPCSPTEEWEYASTDS
eukprot:COSAG01_NODE_3777_length_5704_cov_34.622658_7_plen_44_part_01